MLQNVVTDNTHQTTTTTTTTLLQAHVYTIHVHVHIDGNDQLSNTVLDQKLHASIMIATNKGNKDKLKRSILFKVNRQKTNELIIFAIRVINLFSGKYRHTKT